MSTLFGVLLPVFGLALVDSINPSALAVTLLLITTTSHYVPKVLAYVATIFCVYFTFGVLIMLGLDSALDALGDTLYSSPVYAIQGIIGAAMLAYAIFAPDRKDEESGPRLPERAGLVGIILLGITVTAVEFGTALPYFAAIGILTREDLSAAEWLPVLFVYNIIFVTPPLLLLGTYQVFGTRFEARFQRLIGWFRRESRTTLLWIVGIIGFFLLADSLSFFFDFFEFDFAGTNDQS